MRVSRFQLDIIRKQQGQRTMRRGRHVERTSQRIDVERENEGRDAPTLEDALMG